MSVVGDPWLRDARNKIYVTFRAARRKSDDAVEVARAGREKGGGRKEEPPLEVFLWVALLGVLAKVMMRGRPISLKSMQELQHASMPPAAAACACIHVFAHNTIAWMCKFKSCVCMYVCTTHMRVACARACMRCACSQKRNCECQNV